MEKLKEFAENKRVRMGAKPSLRDLSVLMKQAPQYQKELSRYSAHFSIAESCMTIFNKHVSQLCAVEQVPFIITRLITRLVAVAIARLVAVAIARLIIVIITRLIIMTLVVITIN